MEPEAQEQFRLEARTIANLQHPHIVSVFDFGIADQTLYLAMQYTPGGTLREQHPKGTQLSFEQIVTYVKQIASVLDYAHQQRVIHRDVKPANLLLNARGEVVLSDFGLASSNKQGSRFPHKGQQPPPSLCERLPDLPSAVEDAVFGALAKEPEQRFTTAQDFALALEEACFGTQPLTWRGSADPRSREQDASPAPALLTPLYTELFTLPRLCCRTDPAAQGGRWLHLRPSVVVRVLRFARHSSNA